MYYNVPNQVRFNDDAIIENRAFCRNATSAKQETKLQSCKNIKTPSNSNAPTRTIKVASFVSESIIVGALHNGNKKIVDSILFFILSAMKNDTN